MSDVAGPDQGHAPATPPVEQRATEPEAGDALGAAAPPAADVPESAPGPAPALARATLIYGVGIALSRFLNVVALPLFTAHLDPGEFGVISALAVFGLVARQLFALGLGASTGMEYFSRPEPRHRHDVTVTAFAVNVGSAALMVVATAVAAGPLARAAFGSPDVERYLVVQAVAVGISLMGDALLLTLQFRSRPWAFVTAGALGAVVNVAVSAVLVVGAGRGVRGWVEGSVAGATATLVLAAALALPGVRGRPVRSIAANLVRHGLPMVPGFLFLYVLQYGAHAVLGRVNGIEALGVYAVGFNVGMAMGMATSAFSNAWYPYFQSFTLRQDEGARVFPSVVNGHLYAFGFLTLCFFAGARPVIEFLTAPGFHAAADYVGVTALNQFLIGFWTTLLPGVVFARALHLTAVLQGVASVVAAAATVVLSARLGPGAGPWGLVLGSCTLVALQVGLNARRRYRVSVLRRRRLLGLAAALGAAIATGRIVEDQLASPTPAVAAWVAVVAAYVLVGTRLLTAEERRQALGLVRLPALRSRS